MAIRLTNTIVEVDRNSRAEELGLKPGDIILEIDGRRIRDALDFQFYFTPETSSLLIEKPTGQKITLTIETTDEQSLGIKLAPMEFARCSNRCIFCFVDQMPKGMRKGLYFKDEDYRLSFLNGNYVTLTNLHRSDFERIVEQGLKPLYISVHATDPPTRNLLLGRRNSPDVLTIMRSLAKHDVDMHAQIVAVPTINDGAILDKTLGDLMTLYPRVKSIAIVPVGLTKHRKGLPPLIPPDKAWAQCLLEEVRSWEFTNLKRWGDPVVFVSDEMYQLAGEPIPSIEQYGDLPQVANGVGTIAQFQSELASDLEYWADRADWCDEVFVITGSAAYPTIYQAALDVRRLTRTRIEVIVVENLFFGPQVTVAGLLTGQDIIHTLKELRVSGRVLIPDCTIKSDRDWFLDNLSPEDISRSTGCRIEICPNNAEGFLHGCWR